MKTKKGAAFLTTIILVGITVIAAAALSFMLLEDAFTAKQLRRSAEAYCLAEAGIEEAIQRLWDTSFDTTQFPKTRTLGNGTIDMSLNMSRWGSDRLLIISTGTVGGVLRTIKAEVKYNRPPYFDRAILCNGKILITQGAVVNCNAATGIHSNSPERGGPFRTAAIDVLGFSTDSWVYGNASAVGNVMERRHGHITGDKDNGEPVESLPSFDSTFFNYYLTRAARVYDSTQIFSSSNLPPNGIVYVNGDVHLQGPLTITGCIVATGNISVSILNDEMVTINQMSSFPALMSRGGWIVFCGPTEVTGLIYAAGDIWTISLMGTYGDITLNGSLMANGNVSLWDYATLDYERQNPPGLGTTPIGWILNWREELKQ